VNYFDVDYGNSAFFFLDTRYRRSHNDIPDGPNKTMLGSTQKQNLFEWLMSKKNIAVFKFIMSPVGLTSNFVSSSCSDNWCGFLFERNEILDFIISNQIHGVVFLSGDSHLAYATELYYPGSRIYEFSVSPIDAFDYSLGGYTSQTPWKPEDERKDVLLFSDLGGIGSISFIGMIEVDSLADVPFFKVSIWNRDRVVYNITLTVNDVI
jgi:hypothetical protein